MHHVKTGPHHRWRSAAVARAGGLLAVALLTALLTAGVSAASQGTVRVVSKTKSGPDVYSTIQSAVNAAQPSDWVLIEPGEYDESVRVETPGLHIRGMNRNTVVVDGKNEVSPGGRNGIEIFKTNDVSVENLTVRNFDRESRNGANGNEIWWNGGDGTGQLGADGWHGA